MEQDPTSIAADLEPCLFADLDGWEADDHAAAFAAYQLSANRVLEVPVETGRLGVTNSDLLRVARKSLEIGTRPKRSVARHFFETYFRPHLVRPRVGNGFLTGYFEPQVQGSLEPTETFRYPLYARPPDLVDIDTSNRPSDLDATYQFARQTGAGLTIYYDRAAIEDGALAGRGLELVYLADPIDVFFIHVQGSASILLPDGARMRVAYAAKAGHPYTSIGKKLIDRGVATPETMTLDALRAWLSEHREEGLALMRENRSYVFFRKLDSNALDPDLGAVAAAGVQITPGRTLAVDRLLHTYGTPIWLEATLPVAADGSLQPVRRLMMAQDTGSAIVGPTRGDIFVGLGAEAGKIAGRFRHAPNKFVLLKPIQD